MTHTQIRRTTGAVLVTLGLSMSLAGGIASALVGSDDTVTLATYDVSTGTDAMTARLVADGAARVEGLPKFGTYQLVVTSRAGSSFTGVGRTADVEEWLGTSPVSTAGLVRPFSSDVRVVAGSGNAPAAAAQTFWVASSTHDGPGSARIDWPVTSGDYTVVVTSAGPQPFAGTVGVRLHLPRVFAAGLLALVTGLLCAAFGGWLRRCPRGVAQSFPQRTFVSS